MYKSYKKEKEACSLASRGGEEKKFGGSEREREKQRDREIKRKREAQFDSMLTILVLGIFSLSRMRSQPVLCDKVTTVYRSMVASGWLVLGGAGGAGVVSCVSFLLFFSFFFSFFHIIPLYTSVFCLSFFALACVSVYAFAPFPSRKDAPC